MMEYIFVTIFLIILFTHWTKNILLKKNITSSKITEPKKRSMKNKNGSLTDLHDHIIDNFIKNYSRPIKTPYRIGIFGGSGSGKSFVSSIIIGTIQKMFPNTCHDVIIISQDSYYYGGNNDTNYDIPTAIDFKLLTEQFLLIILQFFLLHLTRAKYLTGKASCFSLWKAYLGMVKNLSMKLIQKEFAILL